MITVVKRTSIRLSVVMLILGMTSISAAGPPYAGRKLLEVLKELQVEGVKLIYSDAVVRGDMVVKHEPPSSDPRVVLDTILAPHGLRVREASNGVLVVEQGPPLQPIETGDPPTDTTVERPAAVFVEEVVVNPSHLRILRAEPESRQFLSRTEVERMPHAADDLYRAVKRLPGKASGDYSAAFSVRGGLAEELLVFLDGVELYEPFHFKDFQSVFSIIDSAAIGGIDLLTGGYPVQYGDKMSGVMDIAVATPDGPTTTTIAASTINARLLSEGSFNEGKGSWVVSARAWYPDNVANLVTSGPDRLQTDYYDVLARVEHQLGSRSMLSGGVLAAYDDLGFSTQDEEESERAAGRYGGFHSWLNLRSGWTDRLFSQTVFAAGRLRSWREGEIVDRADGIATIDDNRAFTFFDLRQDWTMDFGQRHALKWGFDVSRQEAEYHYNRTERPYSDPGSTMTGDEVAVITEPEGWSYGLYAADRFQPVTPLVVELGLRWDDQSWTDGLQLSPRVNLRYALGKNTVLRAAWGRFRQSQTLNELQVEDGVTEFYSAQRSEHWLLAVDHAFANGLGLRVEGYYKDLTELWPRYENLFSPLELFPEVAPDRILVEPEKGRAGGVEVLLKQAAGPRLTWWFGYTLASVEDLIDGDWQPRNWDQRHALTFGLNLTLPRSWNINLAGVAHSGWPTTRVTGRLVPDGEGGFEVEPILGPRNSARLSPYHRVDVRVNKLLKTRSGNLSLMIEVLNLFNAKNVCCIDDFEFVVEDDGTITTVPQEQYWAPILPSVGLRYQF